MTLKFKDMGSILQDGEPVEQALYVAVYFYESSRQPFGACFSTKDEAIRAMNNWTSVDPSKPVRLYKIIVKENT